MGGEKIVTMQVILSAIMNLDWVVYSPIITNIIAHLIEIIFLQIFPQSISLK